MTAALPILVWLGFCGFVAVRLLMAGQTRGRW